MRCAFCGKTEAEVKLLIAGIDACICGDCVELCWNVLQAGLEADSGGKKPKS